MCESDQIFDVFDSGTMNTLCWGPDPQYKDLVVLQDLIKVELYSQKYFFFFCLQVMSVAVLMETLWGWHWESPHPSSSFLTLPHPSSRWKLHTCFLSVRKTSPPPRPPPKDQWNMESSLFWGKKLSLLRFKASESSTPSCSGSAGLSPQQCALYCFHWVENSFCFYIWLRLHSSQSKVSVFKSNCTQVLSFPCFKGCVIKCCLSPLSHYIHIT